MSEAMREGVAKLRQDLEAAGALKTAKAKTTKTTKKPVAR
jgi:hypothetical protein